MNRLVVLLLVTLGNLAISVVNGSSASACFNGTAASSTHLGVNFTGHSIACDTSSDAEDIAYSDRVEDAAQGVIDLVECLAYVTYLGVSEERCFGTRPPSLASLALRAFRHMPLPAKRLDVQPSNGRTLVNFKTNFYTSDGLVVRDLRLLGQPITLRAFPASFTWHFDDGPPLTTTTPGARYPDLEITHDYQRKGVYYPSVDTTYGADWRVGDGPWQRVPGTVTIPGAPVRLEAVEVQPTLVAS